MIRTLKLSLFAAIAALSIIGARSSPAAAQLPRACAITGTLTMAKLRTCIDTLEVRRKSDSVRYASSSSGGSNADVVARLALLEKIINVAGFMGRQIPCSELEAARPATNFPNGEYDISYRQKQLGCGVNDINNSLEYKIGLLAARMPPSDRTVQEYVNSAIAALPEQTSRVDTVRINVSGAPVGDGKGVDGSVYMFPDGTEQWRSNSRHLASQDGITDEYCGQIQINGWDGGFRMLQNRKDNSDATCVPSLPWAFWGPDSHTTWSFAQFPSKNTAASVTAIETYGQSFVIDGGFAQQGYSFGADTSPLAGRNVLLAAQRGGQSLLLAVSPDRTTGNGSTPYPTNRVGAYVDGKAPVGGNPFVIYADGAYRRVKTCNINGTLAFCVQ